MEPVRCVPYLFPDRLVPVGTGAFVKTCFLVAEVEAGKVLTSTIDMSIFTMSGAAVALRKCLVLVLSVWYR